MRIGLCYDLAADWAADGLDAEQAAEFDRPETIDAIAAVLAASGHAVERIGRAEALLRRLIAGARWDLVFNICEGLHGFGRESLVPALLDAYRVPYVFSDPEVLALSLHKAHCKRVVRDAGVPTADFCVLDDPAQPCDLPPPVFVKPIAEGTGKGIGAGSLCRTNEQVVEAARLVIERFRQPALVEAWLPGREFTVGIIGAGTAAEAIGVVEIASNVLDPRHCAARAAGRSRPWHVQSWIASPRGPLTSCPPDEKLRSGRPAPLTQPLPPLAGGEGKKEGFVPNVPPSPACGGGVRGGGSPRAEGQYGTRNDEFNYGFDLKKHYEYVDYRSAPKLEAVAVGHDGSAKVVYRLANDATASAAGAVALTAWRALGGRDGGRIDLRCDAAGRPNFLEANPLPGLHPTDSDLTIAARLAGHDHAWLIGRIMDAACARLGLRWR